MEKNMRGPNAGLPIILPMAFGLNWLLNLGRGIPKPIFGQRLKEGKAPIFGRIGKGKKELEAQELNGNLQSPSSLSKKGRIWE